jgi:predicted membrane protein (TIGR00267 family)
MNHNDGRGATLTRELHLQPVEAPDIFRSAVVITIATLIGHLIPLLPFVWLPRTAALITAIVLSALALFGVGTYQAVTLVGDWRKKGLQMVLIGLGAAVIGFLIGNLFHTAGA